MARAHCDAHKRYVPTCNVCRSADLGASVGFPGAGYPVENDGAPLDPPVIDRDAAIDEAEAAFEAEDEFDEDDELQSISLVTEASSEDKAMALIPRRLIPEGDFDPENGETPVPYDELVRRAIRGYLEFQLTPEDVALLVAGDIVRANQMDEYEQDDEAVINDEEFHEAFDAGFESGVESAPDLMGCLTSYNEGFNRGMVALLEEAITYYGPDARDADAPALSMLQHLARKLGELTK